MKKLAIIAIGMAAVMMACTNKGKTAPGDGSDSDSVAADSLIAEQADTTSRPMFIWMQDGKNLQMHYWAGLDKPVKNKDNAEFFDSANVVAWEIEESFRRNRASYTKLLGENNKCLGIKYTAEVLKDPDGKDASYGEIHGREGIPAAGLKYEFTDKKFNARQMSGFYVAVTDEYLASRKLIDMRRLQNVKPLPANVIKQLEGEYKMKTAKSQLLSQGNKYSYGILQFKGKYKTAKEFGQKVDKCLALEVVMAGDKVYSFPVEGYIYEGMSTWHADDDGEYYGCQITLFEAPDDAIEIAYIEGAPESITTGMYYIRDGKMTRERYEVYHTLVDESAPLWKKDIAEVMKLYVADNPSAHKGAKFAKFRWLDIDTDNNDELWIRSADDKHGAFFNRINGKWGLIATEGADHKVEFRFDYSGNNSPGYLMVTSDDGNPSTFTTVYEIRNSKVVHKFTKHEVYGELDGCTLDGKAINIEAGQKWLDALPKDSNFAIWWQDINE